MAGAMRITVMLGCVGVCAAIAGNARGADESTARPMPRAKAEAASPAANAPALTLAEAQKVVVAARKYEAHPPPDPAGRPAEPRVMMPDFQGLGPPPVPRAETKPESPTAGFVWVPGHYMPVSGAWRWVRGEWAAPATPVSVWIPSRYDPAERKWTPGYWQPDRPDGYEESKKEEVRK
jgi:hypothetical protein